ncbi:acyl-CoA dehydrogenase [Thermosulfidibacter takaii ABI70S6]|uniref:Acyl-CoA dehydrogenase n=1 Tax=Thermosulfidibacter takaii (strain DSM 17441 / JCM 13301 / NBRC 103674 / ABI70S6) TaxID=1298851 RepID=A0A0S3QS75_THET7|nr:acyl-CoA dehydrogenase family protein [Thermosulfidibacter takaii]BAT71195.1 acyl-CoA dehydrogenase [Thermosulfidibacter takaii ABI70S6]
MLTEKLLSEKQRLIKQEMQDFVKWVPRQLIIDMDQNKVKYPAEFLEEAGRRNLLGLRFPQKYGGRGLGWEEEVVALEEVGVLGTSLACLYSLISIVGEAIDKFGTDEQKERYLAPMIAGKLKPAEALTEPRGGSDFFGATTVAEREGDYFILRGYKRFIVGAEGADFFLVYAKTADDEPHKSMTAFLVDRCPEVEVKYQYGLMGTRGGGTGRIYFNNVKVPVENVLGGEAGINCGAKVFYQMMIPERMTSAAGALGMARAALEIAAKYADRRKAFGQKIRRFQAVSFKVADSIMELDAARALVYETARAIDTSEDPGILRRLVSESKAFATEMAWHVVNHAMQIMGGIGYTNVYPIEKMMRDIRLIMIWTGTNEIMRLIIQHEYFKEFLQKGVTGRDIEMDAPEADATEEKVYE